MKKYYYDLHVHSCLSPCGDEDNTPNNIAGMAKLGGIDILALTDHNSSKNCPAFFKACEKYGIIPIAGMELTTSEDIHVVCLFERLSDALAFDSYVEGCRFKLKNKPDIFGHQYILDDEDKPIGEIDDLLINATSLSITDISNKVSEFRGICYPAHIDREANGIISVLGTLPEDYTFGFYELHDNVNIAEYSRLYNIPSDRFIISSDAHYLTDIKDAENYFVFDEGLDNEEIIGRLFEMLRRSR